MQELTTANKVGIANGGKKNLELDNDVRSTTYQRDKTRKHMNEQWGDWTRRCSD